MYDELSPPSVSLAADLKTLAYVIVAVAAVSLLMALVVALSGATST